MVFFPLPLTAGGTIGVVSPSSRTNAASIAKNRKILEARGYKIVIHPQNYLKDGQRAGNDAARIGAIHDMFTDPTIGAIFCARGGNGAIQLLDGLNYKLIKRHPKPIVGYSDITLLLQAIRKKCDFITYHGPLFGVECDEHAMADLFALLANHKKNIRPFDSPQIDCIRKGEAKGELVGGNMTLLQSLIGTPYDWSAKNAILFVEDVGEPLYRLDRMLRHMKLAGKFDGVRAVLVGKMTEIYDGETSFGHKKEMPYGRTLRQIFLDIFPPDVPLCFDFPCGHTKYITTLPIGAQAKLTLDKRGATLSIMPL